MKASGLGNGSVGNCELFVQVLDEGRDVGGGYLNEISGYR